MFSRQPIFLLPLKHILLCRCKKMSVSGEWLERIWGTISKCLSFSRLIVCVYIRACMCFSGKLQADSAMSSQAHTQAHTHTYNRAHTHSYTRARARAHTHTHKYTHTHRLARSWLGWEGPIQDMSMRALATGCTCSSRQHPRNRKR